MKLKIGEFSRFGQVSVSALRYYSDVGLLRPVHRDEWTGYRYYDFDQPATLHRILALKDLGLSLEQIRHLMGEELPPEEIRGMLRLKRAELQGQVRELEERLGRVEARLQQIEMEGKMPDYEVITKKVDPIRVAIVRGVVPNMEEMGRTFDRLFDEVEEHVLEHGGSRDVAGIALFYDMTERMEDVNVAAAMPFQGDLPENDRVTIETLPAVDMMASAVHRGSFATLSHAYSALFNWISGNGYQVTGPSREVYLEYERDADQSKYVTEVQYPVAKG